MHVLLNGCRKAKTLIYLASISSTAAAKLCSDFGAHPSKSYTAHIKHTGLLAGLNITFKVRILAVIGIWTIGSEQRAGCTNTAPADSGCRHPLQDNLHVKESDAFGCKAAGKSVAAKSQDYIMVSSTILLIPRFFAYVSCFTVYRVA